MNQYMTHVTFGRASSFYINKQFYFRLNEGSKRYYAKLSGKDFNYLQQSIVPTMHFQNSLPRLPVPDLEKTSERYINSLKPLVTPEQLQNTINIVNKFKCEEGKELQAELIALNAKNKHTSYISAPWFDMYLKARTPLVLNYNPFLSFKDDPNPQYNTQLLRATNMIVSSLRFKNSLQENILEPEVFHLNPDKSDTLKFRKTMRWIPKPFAWYGAYLFKAFPLDMSQFKNLFSSTRIPLPGRDEIKAFSGSRHIAVLRNGNIYTFDVLDESNNILEPKDICSRLQHILSDPQPPPSHSISVLTTENRDIWADVRKHLLELGNGKAMHQIDSALFVLALDGDSFKDDEVVKYAKTMLHGPSNNRWFDKSFTLILAKDGKAALNFEHAWGDGVAVMRYFNEVYKDSTTHHFVGPEEVIGSHTKDQSSVVKRLDFILDEKVKLAIKSAEEKLLKEADSFKFNIVQHDKIHRENLKKFKLSPDSVAQLGFQMAYYKMSGKFVAVYESCSTSAFKHGRTETVRPLTTATRKCIEEFQKGSLSTNVDSLRGMLSECTKVHNQLTKEAAMGQGFDRHLFGLKYMAEKLNKKIPVLYEDPSYITATNFILSTSTLYGIYFSGGGFGPVVRDGLGVGYGFLDNHLGCLISSYDPQQNGAAYADALNESYDDIVKVLS